MCIIILLYAEGVVYCRFTSACVSHSGQNVCYYNGALVLMRKVSNNLQEIMSAKHITYRELSLLTGISKSNLHKIANFTHSPTQNTMIAIAKGLNMCVCDIFDFDEGKEENNDRKEKKVF